MTRSMKTKSGEHRAERRSGENDGEPSIDPVWESIRAEVAREVEREPILASFLHATILRHRRLEEALSFHLAEKLGGPSLAEMLVREVIDEALAVVTDLETTIVTAPAYTYRAMPPTPTAGQRAKAAVGD